MILILSIIFLVGLIVLLAIAKPLLNSMSSTKNVGGNILTRTSQCLTSSGLCSEDGVKVITKKCIPNAITGLGCTDEGGEMFYGERTQTVPCKLKCIKTKWIPTGNAGPCAVEGEGECISSLISSGVRSIEEQCVKNDDSGITTCRLGDKRIIKQFCLLSPSEKQGYDVCGSRVRSDTKKVCYDNEDEVELVNGVFVTTFLAGTSMSTTSFTPPSFPNVVTSTSLYANDPLEVYNPSTPYTIRTANGVDFKGTYDIPSECIAPYEIPPGVGVKCNTDACKQSAIVTHQFKIAYDFGGPEIDVITPDFFANEFYGYSQVIEANSADTKYLDIRLPFNEVRHFNPAKYDEKYPNGTKSLVNHISLFTLALDGCIGEKVGNDESDDDALNNGNSCDITNPNTDTPDQLGRYYASMIKNAYQGALNQNDFNFRFLRIDPYSNCSSHDTPPGSAFERKNRFIQRFLTKSISSLQVNPQTQRLTDTYSCRKLTQTHDSTIDSKRWGIKFDAGTVTLDYIESVEKGDPPVSKRYITNVNIPAFLNVFKSRDSSGSKVFSLDLTRENIRNMGDTFFTDTRVLAHAAINGARFSFSLSPTFNMYDVKYFSIRSETELTTGSSEQIPFTNYPEVGTFVRLKAIVYVYFRGIKYYMIVRYGLMMLIPYDPEIGPVDMSTFILAGKFGDSPLTSIIFYVPTAIDDGSFNTTSYLLTDNHHELYIKQKSGASSSYQGMIYSMAKPAYTESSTLPNINTDILDNRSVCTGSIYQAVEVNEPFTSSTPRFFKGFGITLAATIPESAKYATLDEAGCATDIRYWVDSRNVTNPDDDRFNCPTVY